MRRRQDKNEAETQGGKEAGEESSTTSAFWKQHVPAGSAPAQPKPKTPNALMPLSVLITPATIQALTHRQLSQTHWSHGSS